MEYRIKDYSINGNAINLPRITTIEDIRLIYNETQKVLICSTAKKENLSGMGDIVVNRFNNTTIINVPTSICVLMPMDKLTIKCDYGDDLSSVESKVEEEADSIEAKIDEIVAAYNNGQNIIDQMVAIQLQTIIGDENIE